MNWTQIFSLSWDNHYVCFRHCERASKFGGSCVYRFRSSVTGRILLISTGRILLNLQFFQDAWFRVEEAIPRCLSFWFLVLLSPKIVPLKLTGDAWQQVVCKCRTGKSIANTTLQEACENADYVIGPISYNAQKVDAGQRTSPSL